MRKCLVNSLIALLLIPFSIMIATLADENISDLSFPFYRLNNNARQKDEGTSRNCYFNHIDFISIKFLFIRKFPKSLTYCPIVQTTEATTASTETITSTNSGTDLKLSIV